MNLCISWSSKSAKYLSTLLSRQKYFLHGIIIEQLNEWIQCEGQLGLLSTWVCVHNGAVCTRLSCLQAWVKSTGDFGVYTI